uniref:Uncharacterized protein n=1 Tax=Glossina pallidipes TaxID=7398 RepID=A0A1A9Z465_GLOPL
MHMKNADRTAKKVEYNELSCESCCPGNVVNNGSTTVMTMMIFVMVMAMIIRTRGVQKKRIECKPWEDFCARNCRFETKMRFLISVFERVFMLWLASTQPTSACYLTKQNQFHHQ